MEIRKAILRDIPRLMEMRKQLLIEEGSTPTCSIDGELERYFTAGLSDGSFLAWVAEEEHEVIAAGGLCFYQRLPSYANPSGRIAYVTNMFTEKKYRRQGIATLLLNEIISEARSLHYTVVRLHASSDGKALYKKFGFTDLDGYMMLKL